MVCAVIERHPDTDHGDPGEHAGEHRLAHPLFNGRDELPGYGPSGYLVDELEAFSPRERGYVEPCVAVLAPSAGLLFVFALQLHMRPYRLLVRHPRGLQFYIAAELEPERFDRHFKVDLPDAGQEELLCLLVHVAIYGRA